MTSTSLETHGRVLCEHSQSLLRLSRIIKKQRIENGAHVSEPLSVSNTIKGTLKGQIRLTEICVYDRTGSELTVMKTSFGVQDLEIPARGTEFENRLTATDLDQCNLTMIVTIY